VPSTKKSLAVRDRTSAQHSGQAAAPAYSTPTGSAYFGDDPPELVAAVALVILEHLVRETGSTDCLFLAFHSAKNRVSLMEGKDQAEQIFNKLVIATDELSKRHPMRSFYG